MKQAGSHNTADITAVIGASGSGKSLWVKQRLEGKKAATRVIVWDARREYAHYAEPVDQVAAFVAQLAAAGPAGKFRLVFWPSHDPKIAARQFGLVCRGAFESGRLLLVAEEISDVTTASFAPPDWRRVITQGRHRALSIIATTQRPALIDKTCLDNATVIRCGRLSNPSSRRYMADMMDVPESTLAALRPLSWVSRNTSTGVVVTETLTPRP